MLINPPTIVPTIIQWNLPVFFHGDTSGSCTLIGNPAPTGNLVDIRNCEYQSSITVVDRYTAMVNFTIYNATQSCLIYCHSATYEEKKILAIIGTAVTANSTITTNISSPTPTNKSTTTTYTPTPSTTSSPTTSMLSITTISTNLPTYTTCTTEHDLKENTSTDTNINMIQNTDSLRIMLILIVVMVSILIIVTVVILILLVWINMRQHKRNTTIP